MSERNQVTTNGSGTKKNGWVQGHKRSSIASESHKMRPISPFSGPPSSPAPRSEGTPIIVTAKEENIMKYVLAHESYTPPGRKSEKGIDNQPEFDDIGQCGLAENDKKGLWRAEVKWLLHVAQTPTVPLAFDYPSLGKVKKEGYEQLSNIAELIDWNLTVCRHDNEVTALIHRFEVAEVERLETLKTYLEHRLEQEQPFLKGQDLEACCALVDYVCAVLVRVMTQAVDSELHHTQCIAVVAKLATKLKMLCKDPTRYARMTLNRVQGLVSLEQYKRLSRGLPRQTSLEATLGESFDTAANTRSAESGSARRQPNEMFEKLFSSADDSRVAIYAIEMVLYRRIISTMASMVLDGLVSSKKSGFPGNAFELSSLAYRIGFDGSTALLGQDRDGEISATSSSIIINRSYVAFRELLRSTKPIQQRYKENPPGPPSDDQDTESQTTVHWEWEDEEPEQPSLQIQDMQDIVTLMVPLMCTHPYIGHLLMQLPQLFGFIVSAKEQIPETPGVDFSALYYIRTNAYESENTGPLTTDVRPVSKCLMAQHRLFELNQTIDTSTNQWNESGFQKKVEADKLALERFQKLSERIDKDWQIDERAIAVKCPRYAFNVTVTALVLVLGGLAVGFSVKTRIPGVDPFNITTFCWVLAGFIILVAKSRRVENWPWRDFLKGRVVCRSITELCSVVGDVKQQDLLVYLLRNELSTMLTTRGPYNKPFKRTGEDGFSIDVEMNLRSLLLAGVIVLKVISDRGPALVCIHLLSKRDDVDTMFHWHRAKEDDDWDLVHVESPNRSKFAVLRFEHLRWSRVLGVYHVPDRKFR